MYATRIVVDPGQHLCSFAIFQVTTRLLYAIHGYVDLLPKGNSITSQTVRLLICDMMHAHRDTLPPVLVHSE